MNLLGLQLMLPKRGWGKYNKRPVPVEAVPERHLLSQLSTLLPLTVKTVHLRGA
jgi:hypothetical protein